MKKKISRIFCYLWITIMCCASTIIVMVCKWAKMTFNVSLNAIINTLLSPLKGTSSDTVLPAVKYCFPVVLTVFVLCVIYIIWDKKKGGAKYNCPHCGCCYEHGNYRTGIAICTGFL